MLLISFTLNFFSVGVRHSIFYLLVILNNYFYKMEGKSKMEKTLFETTKITTVTLILILTLSMLSLFPVVTAHDPPIEIRSWPYIVASPNPVGVNQRVIIVMWIDKPLPDSAVFNDIRRFDYTLTITKPDGTEELLEWPIVEDTTSIQYTLYYPNQVGDYNLLFEYAGQEYTWDATPSQSLWTNDTFSPASKSITLTVQEDQLPDPISSYPLPEEYWTRPIEGQNTDWWSISSNWLSGAYTKGGIQQDGLASNSPHIMWTKPIQDGGVVGGTVTTELDGDTYYSGMAYSTRANNPIIMHGRLYYELPFGNSGGGGGWVCVDLRTGEEIWSDPNMGSGDVPEPTFGYLYDYHDPNQHGTVGSGWLVSQGGFGTQTWQFIDPTNGEVVDGYQVENIMSSGAPFGQVAGPGEIVGPNGNIIRYQLDLQNGWLARWNSANVVWSVGGFGIGQSGIQDGGAPSAYDWNVTIPTTIPAASTIRAAILDDVLLVSDLAPAYSAGAFTIWGTIDPYTVTAISLDPDSVGEILWSREYSAPPDLTREWAPYYGGVDPINRVFVMKDVETMTFTGYSIDTGDELWTTVPQPDYDYFNLQSHIAYGMLYSGGYGGIVHAYDCETGDLVWTYGNGGPGNNTDAGLTTAWGKYPQFTMAIADGKIFTATYEHSPNSPHYKGMMIRAIDAFTGDEVWKVMGGGSAFEYGSKSFAIASGYIVWLNAYDMQIYVAGKGPSATTVKIEDDVIPLGNEVLIKGTVIDTSAGTKQDEQIARFPYGVPAVSDESMGPWMEYVYMQKPRPAATTGVDVLLTIIDPNMNLHEITATSDGNGVYSILWEPPVPGKYTLVANFEGNEGYWPSWSETVFAVSESSSPTTSIEPETPNETADETPDEPIDETPDETTDETPDETPNTEEPTPIISTEVAIIAAVAVAVIIGGAAYWALKRK